MAAMLYPVGFLPSAAVPRTRARSLQPLAVREAAPLSSRFAVRAEAQRSSRWGQARALGCAAFGGVLAASATRSPRRSGRSALGSEEENPFGNSPYSGKWSEAPFGGKRSPFAGQKSGKTREEQEYVEDQKEERAELAAERAAAPAGPTDLGVAQLLTWARKQPSLIFNPKVLARGVRLVASMPIPKGTPLIGVMPEFLLGEETWPASTGSQLTATLEEECQRLLEKLPEPGDWPVRLALRLLRQRKDPRSAWQAYLGSLPVRPAAPALWSKEQLRELQYPSMRKAVTQQTQRLREFYEEHLRHAGALGEGVDLDAFTSLVLTAASRAIEAGSGHRVFAPALDLVGPPDGYVDQQAAAEEEALLQSASCELILEDRGEDGEVIPVLYAARDLAPGDVLSRAVGLNSDDLFQVHGTTAPAQPGECVDVVVSILDGTAQPWQVSAVLRLVPGARPSRMPGDLLVHGKLRCPEQDRDDAAELVGHQLFSAAYILSCGAEDELDEEELRSGLSALFGSRRVACLRYVERLLKGCKGEFATTRQEDAKLLGTLEGNRRVAASYRLEKKRVIDLALAALERAASQASAGGGMPFAVTGMTG